MGSAFENRSVDCLKAVGKAGGDLTTLLPMFLLIPFGGILLVFGYAPGIQASREYLHNHLDIGGSNFGGGTDSHASAVSRRANGRFADIGLALGVFGTLTALFMSAF
ncbi:hypothetical protein GGD63_005866 [Bradyrhizobium sp. cir1]|uniref:hypothetical protein n=1 Tax=Bradyrhizobium sp. cir1 TaxID=1445730 RepID=UPI0017966D36|nr:hypothetical protein [Bradyrhizobium sp. cir1]MBB4373051.1 hypothetical protein [Bradyrhizobium sp. cir1]